MKPPEHPQCEMKAEGWSEMRPGFETNPAVQFERTAFGMNPGGWSETTLLEFEMKPDEWPEKTPEFEMNPGD